MKHSVKTLALLPLLAFAILLIALAGPFKASAASAASPGHTSVQAQHFSVPRMFSKNSQQSINWSGYAAVNGHYTSVSANWTQPSVKCTRTAYAAFWVGLDGDGSNSVEQTGADSDCQGRSPTYYAWYEMYPNLPVDLSNPVSPGDSMSASVTAGSNGSFKLVISDQTRGWSFQTTQTLQGAQLASAEAIAEAPSNQFGVLPLADFGTVNFSNTVVNGQSIGSFGPQEIVMATRTGTVKAQPSSLSGGTAFSVTWKHS